MAKLLLDMTAMQEEFYADSAMIGIVTAMPAYRLCWLLNNHFDLDFIRDPEQNISLKKKDVLYHLPIYQYELPNSSHKYLLYKLKIGKESLLPETRNLDYIWLIKTANPENDAFDIAARLKKIPDIQLAQILAHDQLKSLNNLLV